VVVLVVVAAKGECQELQAARPTLISPWPSTCGLVSAARSSSCCLPAPWSCRASGPARLVELPTTGPHSLCNPLTCERVAHNPQKSVAVQSRSNVSSQPPQQPQTPSKVFAPRPRSSTNRPSSLTTCPNGTTTAPPRVRPQARTLK